MKLESFIVFKSKYFVFETPSQLLLGDPLFLWVVQEYENFLSYLENEERTLLPLGCHGDIRNPLGP